MVGNRLAGGKWSAQSSVRVGGRMICCRTHGVGVRPRRCGLGCLCLCARSAQRTVRTTLASPRKEVLSGVGLHCRGEGDVLRTPFIGYQSTPFQDAVHRRSGEGMQLPGWQRLGSWLHSGDLLNSDGTFSLIWCHTVSRSTAWTDCMALMSKLEITASYKWKWITTYTRPRGVIAFSASISSGPC